MASGQLRIYLGAAPGVGKTYAMLAEALGDTLRIQHLPGGGRSVVVTLPAAAGTLVPVPGDTATCPHLPSAAQTKA